MKPIRAESRHYNPRETEWHIRVPQARGPDLILVCGIQDLERLHSIVREALQIESCHKLMQMEK